MMEENEEGERKVREYVKNDWKIAASVITMFIFPFIIAKALFCFPEGRFSREVWFSFFASYSGAIATFIVLYLTISENQRSFQKEKERLKRNYEIEKELDLSKKILKVLLLDNYDFITLAKIDTEYARYCQDIYDIQYEVPKLIYDKNGYTARDKFLNALFQTERYHTLQLIVEKPYKVGSEEEAKTLLKHIVNRTTDLSHQMIEKRRKILDLYDKYVEEMKMKEFEDTYENGGNILKKPPIMRFEANIGIMADAILTVTYIACIFFAVYTHKEVYNSIQISGNSILDSLSYIVMMMTVATYLKEQSDLLNICTVINIVSRIIFIVTVVISAIWLLTLLDVTNACCDNYEIALPTVITFLTGVFGVGTMCIKYGQYSSRQH